MSVISKTLFYEKIGPEIKCKNVLHQWTDNCLESNFKVPLVYFKGVFYLYVPIYLVKLIIDHKKIDRKYLINITKSFFKSLSYGNTLGALIFGSICISSNLCGRLYYFNVTLIAGFVSGLSIFLEQPDNKYFNTLLWLSMVVEAVFHNAYYFKILHFSRFKETAVFMFASSLLMHLLTNTQPNKIPANIWFYKPKIRSNSRSCNHSEANADVKCANLCFKELSNCFGIAFALNSVRSFIKLSKFFFKNPFKTLFKSVFNIKNFKFGMIFGAYAGTFRMISCLLHKYNKHNTFNAAIAGFAAGFAYYIKPTISILAIAVTTILQILFNKFLTVPKLLEKAPLKEILFMCCNAVLLLNAIAAYPTCPRNYVNMLKIASGGLFDKLYFALIQQYFC